MSTDHQEILQPAFSTTPSDPPSQSEDSSTQNDGPASASTSHSHSPLPNGTNASQTASTTGSGSTHTPATTIRASSSQNKPTGGCPSCPNPEPNDWRFGTWSKKLVCNACSKYEKTHKTQRPAELELKRLKRLNAGAKR
ncbi:hypothetical protein C8F01DRAFT_1370676 [Mycena amicta]|nr:hypothetical protein C8F01DRAFT_1370676 [Mycena amicta]